MVIWFLNLKTLACITILKIYQNGNARCCLGNKKQLQILYRLVVIIQIENNLYRVFIPQK